MNAWHATCCVYTGASLFCVAPSSVLVVDSFAMSGADIAQVVKTRPPAPSDSEEDLMLAASKALAVQELAADKPDAKDPPHLGSEMGIFICNIYNTNLFAILISVVF